MKSKLPSHMRIAALQCDFEGGSENTLVMPGKWKNFGFNVEQLFHTHAELYNAIYEEKKHKEKLTKYLAKTKENDITVILYLNCHILLPSQDKMRTQWGKRQKDGTFIKLYNDVYYSPCMNSSWTDYFLGQIEKLSGFDIAGIFFDGPAIHDCYCPSCKRLFKQQHGKTITEASIAEVRDFFNKQCIEFSRKIYWKVKDVNKEWISYSNSNLLHGYWSSEEMYEVLKFEDIVGTEGGFQFYTQPKDTPLWKCSFSAKMVETIAKNRSKIIFMAGDHKTWSWYMHTPAETKLCYASALANGSSVWYGIHCSSDMLESEAGNAAREMLTFDKSNDELYCDTVSLAETAIFYSFNTAKKYPAIYQQSDFYGASSSVASECIGDYSLGLDGAIAMLFYSGIPYDVVSELSLNDLSKYKTIILPNAACLNDASRDALTDFVKQGGILIADGETSLYDENLKKNKTFSLSEVFGADFEGKVLEFQPFDYFCLDVNGKNLIADKGVKYFPAPFRALKITPYKNTKILAELCPPLTGRYAGKPKNPKSPFIVANQFEKGKAYFIAGTFFELYYSYGFVHYIEILRNLLNNNSPQTVKLLSASDAIEVTYRKNPQSGKELIHLVNYTGSMNRPIGNVVPIVGGELIINKPFKSATALVAGKNLEISENGSILLPEIQEFEVIQLEV